MSNMMHARGGAANLGTDKLTLVSDKTAPIQQILIDATKRLIGDWAGLATLLGLSNDTAKNRMKGSRDFTAEELAALLRSEHGYEFLLAITEGYEPRWLRICRPLMEVAEVKRLQAAARRRLHRAVEGAIDADRDIAATIARAETFQDQEFHSAGIDALRAVAGPRHRTLAPATKRGRS